MTNAEWISVKDRAPEWPCIVVWGGNPPTIPHGITSVHSKKGSWYFDSELIGLETIDGERVDLLVPGNAITHWMPLPEPPRGGIMKTKSNRSDTIYWHDLRKNPDDLPELKGGYSEAVILWTSGKKVLTAIYDGVDFCCDAEYWESVGEDVIAWYYAPVFDMEDDDE